MSDHRDRDEGEGNYKESSLLKNPVSIERDASGASHRKSHKTSLDSLYPPDPVDAVGRPSKLKGTAGYIIVTEFCERLAYYGLAGSLVLFFERQLNYSNAEADVQYSAWAGFCYVTPLLGGYIADTYFGRFKTIVVFCLIYLVGLIMAVIGSAPGNVNPAFFFPAIYIIALGTGGIKPNVSTMGADQFDDRYSQDRKEKESFFNWFYWSINLGALISHTIVAYICQYGIPQLGGEDWGFLVGYSIPATMMAAAIVIFLLGAAKYRKQIPKGSVLATAFKIGYEALWTNRGVTGTRHILDKAKSSNGGSFGEKQVEGVKLVTRLTPFLVAMIPYWGIYSQMSTTFQNQGCQMNLSLGSINVPIAALSCFDTGSILLLVPVFDGFIYPYFKKIGYPLSMLQKIGLGFVFAILAMGVASIVETMRLEYAATPGNWYDKSARDNITPCQNIDDYNPYQFQNWYSGLDDADKPSNCYQTCDDTYVENGITYLSLDCIDCDDIPQMSHLSVFWQSFQFVLIGTSEILAVITGLEFFYSQSPTVMRSVAQSLNLATNAVGTFLSIPILLMVNSKPGDEWVPENLDDGHLSYYFLLLAGLMGGSLVYLYFISRHYEYKTAKELMIFEESSSDDEEEGDDDTGLLSLSQAVHDHNRSSESK